MWEILSGASLLSSSDGGWLFDTWRRGTGRRATQEFPMLRRLAPPRGYMADFLTPTRSTGDLEEGIDAVLATSRERLRIDMGRLDAERRLPGWARPLAEGDRAALGQLEQELRAFHHTAIAPYQERVSVQVGADRAIRVSALASGGVDRLLATLHPRIRWEPPVLTIDYSSSRVPDRDVQLDGRGLLVRSSFFCWPDPLTLRDPELPPVLVLPVEHQLGWAAPPNPAQPATRGERLTALLGATRTTVLHCLTEGQGYNTTQLARRTGISIPSASQHLTILREAGLTTSSRHGKQVLHTLTPLGYALLESSHSSHPGRAIQA
ncbi:ArsR/SmtB family transcription factor [Nonomuraea sp. NPDC050556]|uniref:ArsR/SmtB family transcription factor n=1 Tax=Nonomuraea sp. NPDC050556 TaxID=3364369 RepID=UPI0037B5207B